MNNQQNPPQWLLRFFRWFCHPDFQEDIEGDLIELYERKVEEYGRKRANRIFFFDVISLIRLNLLKPFKNFHHIIHYTMYKNYFKIAWRSMLRQKLYSFINIGGLAIGLTCFIMIFHDVQHELSYDRFYKDADQIYRIYQKQDGNVFLGSDYFAVTPAGLAPTLEKECPEVEAATTMREQSALLSFKKNNFWEKGLYGDTDFFEVFAFQFIQGNPKTALQNPKSIVLTESLAKKVFGSKNPMGKSIIYQNGDPYTITGIIKDPPGNISFKFSYIVDMQSSEEYMRDIKAAKWNNNSFYTFLKLKKNADPHALEAKMPALIKKHVDYGKDFPFKDKYLVNPISELHLQTNINFDIGLKGNPKYVYLFSLIAVIVLLLACVNYMNLAIARSIKRANEVGLRKVIGAVRGQLIGQFLSESILIAFLALILAMAFTQILLPLFGYLLERPIELNLFDNFYLIPGLILLVIIVGLISGSYPAIFMSSLQPIHALKGKLSRKLFGMKVQKFLIIGQYTTSIVLIISSLIIYRQFQFIQAKELGYNKDYVITVQLRDWSLYKHFEKIKNECLKNPQILSLSASNSLPTNIDSSTLIDIEDDDKEIDDLTIYRANVDYDYLDVFGIELVAGRNFSPKFKTDQEQSYLINETAARIIGWTPEKAIGKYILSYSKKSKYKVIGVVKDFHMHSMHMAIQPLMLKLRDKQYFSFISVKVRPEKLPQTMDILQKTMKKYSPYPFEYAFLDDQFDQLYKDDTRLGEIFGFFTILSILIASLGLFGLAAFTAQQRTKEIGIRKVLGASIQNIMTILSKDFLTLVVFSFLLAIPIAWYMMHQWLQDYAYRVDIEWWIFALAGLSALIVAFFTISFQSLKAALANPVDSLKDE